MLTVLRKVAALALVSLLLQSAAPLRAQQPASPQPAAPKDDQPQQPVSAIRVTSELVLANVVGETNPAS